MTTAAFRHHFSFEFRSGIRNRTLLLLFYLFPLGFYFLASAMMTSLNPAIRETLIPAMVFFAVLTSALLGIPDPIVKAREAGIFRSYKIHGIPELSILVVPALTTLMHMVLVALIITVTAPLMFDAVLPASWLGFLLAFFLMVLASTGIGLLFGVVAPNSQSATLMGQAIFLPSMLIGGLMFPSAYLPDMLAKLSRLLPTSHAMNLYNVYARGLPSEINPYLSILVLLLGAVLTLSLAIYLFNWDSQNQTRKGHPSFAFAAAVPYVAAALIAFVPTAIQGAGVYDGDLYVYTQTEASSLTQDGVGNFTQLAWYQDTLVYTRLDTSTLKNLLWLSRNGENPVMLVANTEPLYPFSFTEEGQILFAQNTTAVTESQWLTDVYTISTEADATPQFIGQLDSTLAMTIGCGGGSPLPTDWQRWTELGFGGQHRILEMTPYGIVYSLDCAGMRTGLLNLETNETHELGFNFGNAVLSPDRTQVLGTVFDTRGTDQIRQLAVADLRTLNLRLYETAAMPDQTAWAVDGTAVFYTVYETRSENIPVSPEEQEALNRSFGVPGEGFAAFPLYNAAIHRYELSTNTDEVIYEAPDDVASIARLLVIDENTLIFSQIPNLQAWIAAIADGQFDPSAPDDTNRLQLGTVPVRVLRLDIASRNVSELGHGINLFAAPSQG